MKIRHLVSFSGKWLPELLVSLPMLASIATASDLQSTIETCNDCHGDQGVSQWTDMPTIAGIDAFTHSNALYMYRDEARPCSTVAFRQGDTERPEISMCSVASDLSDEQIEAIAAHYADLPFVPARQDYDPELAQKGEAIHEDACDRCHSDGGANPEDEASILAGQWMGYLESTFEEYASGKREQPKKMKDKLDELGDDDIDALIHYYASQQ